LRGGPFGAPLFAAPRPARQRRVVQAGLLSCWCSPPFLVPLASVVLRSSAGSGHAARPLRGSAAAALLARLPPRSSRLCASGGGVPPPARSLRVAPPPFGFVVVAVVLRNASAGAFPPPSSARRLCRQAGAAALLSSPAVQQPCPLSFAPILCFSERLRRCASVAFSPVSRARASLLLFFVLLFFYA